MPLQPVTFLTVAAHVVHTEGQSLSFEMIVGIKVGKESTVFKHNDHDLLVDPGARPSPQRVEMPSLMASRLIPFAKTCLEPEGRDYDSSDFTLYMSGFQATPGHNARSKNLRLKADPTHAVRAMGCHVVYTKTGKAIHAFIGLSGQRALTVYGQRGPFGIAKADDLVRVYGDGVIALVTGPV
jgi:hypothetical protein